jgi:hypothetical protein
MGNRPLLKLSLVELHGAFNQFGHLDEAREIIFGELDARDTQESRALLLELSERQVDPRGDASTAPAPEADVSRRPETVSDFVKRFLADRGLSEPSGQPLYRYHVHSKELDELRPLVSKAMMEGRLTPHATMGFCLWAAEWWRLNYTGGPWKWAPLLEELGRAEYGPGGRYRDLQQVVSDGLAGWGRPMLRVGDSTGFLVSLACEGGLPLRLLLKEQAHLKRYFKGLLEEFRLFGGTTVPKRELAERVRDRLPKMLRQEVVYELSADLIEKIWQFQRELGETLTPIRDLDAIRPDWRDELPVRVTDSIARTLLNDLLLDAVEVARGGRIKVRWDTFLRPNSQSTWSLGSGLHLPPALDPSDFNALFGRTADEPVPQRFDLCVQPEAGRIEVVAIASERSNRAQGRWIGIEPLPAFRSEAADLLKPRTLIARTPQEMFSTDRFPGATGLTELPWVFLPEDPDSPTSQEYRLAGQGSVRLKQAWALIATDGNRPPLAGPGATIDLIGELAGLQRSVYRVSGKVTVESDEGDTVVVTGAAVDTSQVGFRLSGVARAVGRDGVQIFCGRPSLHEYQEAEAPFTVPTSRLRWKPDVPGGKWGSYDDNAVGDGRLRYVDDGAVRFSTRVRILPASAKIVIRPSPDPTQGEIVLAKFGAGDVSVVEPDLVDAEVSAEHDRMRVRLHAPEGEPDEVTVAVDWGARGRITLRLPFPASRAAFLLPDGRRLPPGGRIAAGLLTGVTAEAIVPNAAEFEVQGRYDGTDVYGRWSVVREMDCRGEGQHWLNLAELELLVQSKLEESLDLDGAVKLLIHSNQAVSTLPPCQVHIKRFDLELVGIERDPPVVGLDDQSAAQVGLDELNQLELEAISLLEPDREPVLMEKCGVTSWRIPEESMEPGPYLILGRQGGWYRVRPMRWFVIDAAQGLGPAVQRSETLAEAYAGGFQIGDDDERLASVAWHMARNPAHPDWSVAFEYLQLTNLPVQSFPLLRLIARSERATAMAATVAGVADFALVWERLEKLSVAWWQIPLTKWEDTIESFFVHRRDQFAAVPDPEIATDLLTKDLDARISRLVDRMPGLQPALAFLRSRLLCEPLPPAVSRIANPQILQYLAEDYNRHRFEHCPTQRLGPAQLPALPEIADCVLRLQQERHPATHLFVPRRGRYQDATRADFADAPALVAVLGVNGTKMPRKLASTIRRARDCDPDWFDQALQLAHCIAFGSVQSDRLNNDLDA